MNGDQGKVGDQVDQGPPNAADGHVVSQVPTIGSGEPMRATGDVGTPAFAHPLHSVVVHVTS